MQAIKRFALLVCALALFAAPATANATITTKTIDYGPYTIPAGNGDPHDHENAGMIQNQIVNNIAKPCTGCTIIGVTPDLVYTDGTKATISQGPMLHHAMFAAQSTGKSDVTCAGTGPGLLGERFFASGATCVVASPGRVPVCASINSTNWQRGAHSPRNDSPRGARRVRVDPVRDDGPSHPCRRRLPGTACRSGSRHRSRAHLRHRRTAGTRGGTQLDDRVRGRRERVALIARGGGP